MSSIVGWSGQATLPTIAVRTVTSVAPVTARNWSTWCEPMSTRIPPVADGSQNQSGRRSAHRVWGPAPTTCTMRPTAPAWARRTASAIARFSNRSVNSTVQRPPVSAMAACTSASCSAVVTPGLSARTCLPARSASTAIPARSLGTAAVTIRSIEGSAITSSRVRASDSPCQPSYSPTRGPSPAWATGTASASSRPWTSSNRWRWSMPTTPKRIVTAPPLRSPGAT